MTSRIKKNLTATTLVILVVAALVELPNIFVLGLIQVISFLALREYYKLSNVRSGTFCSVLGMILSLSLILPNPQIHLFSLSSIVIIYASYLVLSAGAESGHAVADLGKAITGWFYVIWLFGYMTRIVLLPDATNWLLFLFIATAGRNIWAGLVGRHFPGTPISWTNARKTYSGAVVGILGALGTCYALRASGLFFLPTRDILVLGIILGVLGQLGDLVESMLKRCYGAVDSSRLLPGQGGVLDTIDSFLFTAPAAYYYQIFAAGLKPG